MEYILAWIVLATAFVFLILPVIGSFSNMDDDATYLQCLGDGAVLMTSVVIFVGFCGCILWALGGLTK